jgi:AbrB family looped-hinge helix DNA binding protein
MAAAIATVTSKGQITLPMKIRDGLNIKTGDKVIFTETKDGWDIKALPADPMEVLKYLGRGLENSGLTVEGLHAEFEADDEYR